MAPRALRKNKADAVSAASPASPTSPVSPVSPVTPAPQVSIVRTARARMNPSPLAGKKRRAEEDLEQEEDLGHETSDEEDPMPPPVLDLGPPPAKRLPNTLLPPKMVQPPFWVHPDMKLSIYKENSIIAGSENKVLACMWYFARGSGFATRLVLHLNELRLLTELGRTCLYQFEYIYIYLSPNPLFFL